MKQSIASPKAPSPSARSKTLRANLIYIVLFLIFIGFFAMREWRWRFIQPFSLRFDRSLTNQSTEVPIVIDQFTETAVDTVRSEFNDPRSGITRVMIWQTKLPDTIRFDARGHYYGTAIPITFSGDRSREILLIPNSEQGMALGIGELVYLDGMGKLAVDHIESPNIGDMDSDGVYEVFDRLSKTFKHLDRTTRTWESVELRRKE